MTELTCVESPIFEHCDHGGKAERTCVHSALESLRISLDRPERRGAYAAASFFSWAARRDTLREPVFL